MVPWDLFLFADKDNYQYPAAIPMNIETHGGDDVAIYSRGPWSHLFSGVMEQSTIPYILGYAACIGPYTHSSERPPNKD